MTRGVLRAFLCSLLCCPLLSAAHVQLPEKQNVVQPRLLEKILSSASPTPVILRFRHRVFPGTMDLQGIRSELCPINESRARALRAGNHVFDIRPFQLQATIAARIDAEGLGLLLENSDLLAIEADESWELHTEEGLALTGGTVLQNFGFTGEGAAIAIIDTGIDPYHPSLGGAPIPNSKIVRGLDTADGDNDPRDCSGHGTAVASIAAGVSYQWSPNSYFAGGMAPQAKILAYKAAPDSACNSLRESAVIAAIEDALLHAHGDNYELVAINLSGGAGHFTGACDDHDLAMSAVAHLATENGIAIIASAGNNGFTDGIAAPACLRDVISVGSVWDSKAGLSGSFFCLDESCSRSCDDAFKNATEPTCYANSGPELDLLAPSEYLLAAQAGGQTTSFGGTSGAAPYVTGAIALLNQEFPLLSPENIRLRLKASGLLRTDPKNSRSTPMLDALEALSDSTVINDDGRQTLLPSTDGLFHSRIDVSDSGEIGELRILLRLSHPHPASLKIYLRAPGGSSICLEDHPTDLQGGLSAYYPVDRQSREGLSSFSGMERHGSWELIIEDDGWSDSASLESWALHFSKPIPLNNSPESWSQIIPIVARGPGAGQTYWTSDLQLFNPSPYLPVEFQIYFVPQAGKEHSEILQKSILLSGRRLLRIDDLIQGLFNLNTGSGELIIRNPEGPLLSSMTITTRGREGGRYGQYIMPVAPNVAEKQFLNYLAGGALFRTNIGISELSGRGARGSISLFDTAGATIPGGPIAFDLGPYEILRLDRVLKNFAPGTENAWARMDSDGNVQAWASVVDEATGDGTFIPAKGANEASSWTIPVIARTSGQANSQWRSELRILNHGRKDIVLQLEFRPSNTDLVLRESLLIKAEHVEILSDPVLEIFGRTAASGALRLLSEDQAKLPLIISSRIYNQTEAGSYGQAIPASSSGLTGPSTIIQVEDSPTRHSNLLLTEDSGTDLHLRLELRNEHDAPLGTAATVELKAWKSLQINDLLNFMDLAGGENYRLEISPIESSGTYLAFLSIVDEISGDAISVPASELIDSPSP